MLTNIGKSKGEIVLELLVSLNQGDSGYRDVESRVDNAIKQYDALVARGIIVEDDCD